MLNPEEKKILKLVSRVPDYEMLRQERSKSSMRPDVASDVSLKQFPWPMLGTIDGLLKNSLMKYGYSEKEVAKYFGVPQPELTRKKKPLNVHRRMRAYPPKPKKFASVEERDAWLFERYKEGYTVPRIAAVLNMGLKPLYTALERNPAFIKYRDRLDKTKKASFASSRENARRNAKIKQMWEKGKSQTWIANELGLAPGLVSAILSNPVSHLQNPRHEIRQAVHKARKTVMAKTERLPEITIANYVPKWSSPGRLQREIAYEMFKKNYPDVDIADYFGVSRERIRQVRNQYAMSHPNFVSTRTRGARA
jgi:predicted transcriptional regulator